MALLASYRRYWIAIVLIALAVPMLAQALTPTQRVSVREARRLAPLPGWPETSRQWFELPRRLERFVTDHYGLRETLVRANAVLRYRLVSPTDLRVMYGRNRWLLFNGDGMLQQSLGLFQRNAEIARFADFAAVLHRQYRARGIRFLVVIPPNSTDVVATNLPRWFRPAPHTEYDTMMAALIARTVPVADLRAALQAASGQFTLYRQADTHWNRLGALVAFNAAVRALDKTEWQIEPARVYRGLEPVRGGDLARMLGAPDDINDEDARIDLSSHGSPVLAIRKLDTRRDTGGNITETAHDGPRVVILGDSFTETAWRDYFGLHVSRLVWIHHELCDFVPDIVDAQKPDIIILAPTERFMFCWNRNADAATTVR